jgi:hypothetical protein
VIIQVWESEEVEDWNEQIVVFRDASMLDRHRPAGNSRDALEDCHERQDKTECEDLNVKAEKSGKRRHNVHYRSIWFREMN